MSKIKPAETEANEDGWIIFKNFDFEISSPLKAKSNKKEFLVLIIIVFSD